MTSPLETVLPVGLGSRAYDVVIGKGLLAQAGDRLAPLAPRGRVVVVADETVAGLYGEALKGALTKAGLAPALVSIPPGEASKSFDGLARLIDQLLALEVERGDLLVAFGGGVVGDLAGFAAAVYKRGLDFAQIPTTLLAQVDSSVGGKTAINTARGKNLVGAFHQPRLVLVDVALLETLAVRQLRAGYAEVLKYGLIADADFFRWLEAYGAAALALESGPLVEAVARSVRMKAAIVAQDERETGRRALLNLGHTFGHALEAEAGYGGALLHGEAVAVGCALAFRFSLSRSLCAAEDATKCAEVFEAAGLPTRLAEVSAAPFEADRLMAHMAQDKKAEGGALTLVLAKRIGEAVLEKGVDRQAVRDFLVREGAV